MPEGGRRVSHCEGHDACVELLHGEAPKGDETPQAEAEEPDGTSGGGFSKIEEETTDVVEGLKKIIPCPVHVVRYREAPIGVPVGRASAVKGHGEETGFDPLLEKPSGEELLDPPGAPSPPVKEDEKREFLSGPLQVEGEGGPVLGIRGSSGTWKRELYLNPLRRKTPYAGGDGLGFKMETLFSVHLLLSLLIPVLPVVGR